MNEIKIDTTKVESIIKQQYNDVLNVMKDVKTVEGFIKLAKEYKRDFECEINGTPIKEYNNEGIEFCRIDYKNILIYFLSEEFKPNIEHVTIYDDSGVEIFCGNVKNFKNREDTNYWDNDVLNYKGLNDDIK